jgi:hypothetical protein
MTARERACRWMQRYERQVIALGLLGMLGFVGVSVAAVGGMLGSAGYVAGTIGSLLLYAAALLIGTLGDSFVLDRLREGSLGAPSRAREVSAHGLVKGSENLGSVRSSVSVSARRNSITSCFSPSVIANERTKRLLFGFRLPSPAAGPDSILRPPRA